MYIFLLLLWYYLLKLSVLIVSVLESWTNTRACCLVIPCCWKCSILTNLSGAMIMVERPNLTAENQQSQ